MADLKGQCLCGQVVVIGKGELDYADACHCSMCRRQNAGGAFYAAHFSEGIDIKGDSFKWYSSSEIADRGFCTECGSTIAWQMKQRPEMVSLTLGLFDDVPARIERRIFADEGGDYGDIPTDVPHTTAAEAIAHFEASLRKENNV